MKEYDDYLRSVNKKNCQFINQFEGDKRIIDLCISGSEKLSNVDFMNKLKKQTQILEKKAKKRELVEKVKQNAFISSQGNGQSQVDSMYLQVIEQKLNIIRSKE